MAISRMLLIDCLAQIEKLSIIRRMNSQPRAALERAIAAAGGVTSLAKLLGLRSHAVVHNWRLSRVPAEHCPSIEAKTGVRCEDLRPDVAWDVLRCPCDAANDDQAPQRAEQGAANA